MHTIEIPELTITREVTYLTKLNFPNITGMVSSVGWKAVGTDEQGNTGNYQTVTALNISKISETFIPYQDLTENVIFEWIDSIFPDGTLDEEIKQQVERDYTLKLYPPINVFSDNFPWNIKAD